MIQWIGEHPESDPYTGASGVVREVAIDRWLNQALVDGMIQDLSIDPVKVSLTRLGKAWVEHLKVWEDIKKKLEEV